jgi:hypothetical protein
VRGQKRTPRQRPLRDRQDPSPEAVAVCRESTPLGIGQSQAPSPELLAEDAVLFPQVLDDLKLMAIPRSPSATRKIRSRMVSIMGREAAACRRSDSDHARRASSLIEWRRILTIVKPDTLIGFRST